MYVFDAHCDRLWKKVKGGTECKKSDDYKCICAVFEGASTREDVAKQLMLLKDENALNDVYIAFEGLSWVKEEKDIALIKKYKPVYASPTWNRANFLGGSCFQDAPLTQLGKEVLTELDMAKIYIDAAHSGRRMFFDLADEFENVIFSHGNVFAQKPHVRNLTDKQIKTLVEKNTFLGLSLYKEFVGGDRAEDFVKNVDYVLDAGGEDIVGIGSDLDGCEDIIENGENVFEKIYECLLKKNYSETLISKLFYGNLKHLIEKRQI